ncbi:putative adhesin [Streptomyces vinaceus]|uniref:putative adhesin n=1 Tax=Streptomyces vinaceus TaxID=1960 RepID=UPI003829866B
MKLNWQNYIRFGGEIPASYEEMVQNVPATAAFLEYLNYTYALNYEISQLDFSSLSEDDLRILVYQFVSKVDGVSADASPDSDLFISEAWRLFMFFAADTLEARKDPQVYTECTLAPIELAFVTGHGAQDKSASHVTVPEGVTLHFLSGSEENLLVSVSLRALTQGENVKSKESFAPGDLVPNYVLSPEEDDYDVASIVQANTEDLPIFFVGQEPLQSGNTALCTDPEKCAALKTRHECEGVLARLKNVKNLYFMSCRGILGRNNRNTTRAPGEKIPIHSIKSAIKGVDVFLSRRSTVAKKLARLSDKDKAILLSNSLAKEKLIIFGARELLKSKGDIIYYSMYLASSAADRKRFDSSDTLKKAKNKAIDFIDKFTRSDHSARQSLLDYLKSTDPSGEKVKFLAERIPGFDSWRSLGRHWDTLTENNTRVLQLVSGSGGTINCLIVEGAALLYKYGENLLDQDPHLSKYFSNHKKGSILLAVQKRAGNRVEAAVIGEAPHPDVLRTLLHEFKKAMPSVEVILS